jgi:monoamine oxidase
MRNEVDLVIVGAGAAGLAAARQAGELGLSYLVCEAMDRIGGRAYTESTTFGTPWDRGGHWMHSGSINPFSKLADKYGFRYEREILPELGHDGSRWLTEEETTRVDAIVHGPNLWGAIERAGKEGRDVSAAAVVDMNHPNIAELRTGLAGAWGLDIPEVSTRDDGGYNDTVENWPVEDGYGAVVARHAEGIPVELNTAVTKIRWDGTGVVVETGAGTIAAKVVVITVSTRIIQDNVIKFSPELPVWKREAYDAMSLGNANKVTFKIDRNLLAGQQMTAWVRATSAQGIWFQIRAFDRDMITGHFGGALGEAVEAEGEGAILAMGRQALVAMYGSAILKEIQAEACTRWRSEPWIRGAYAGAQPGKAHLRKDLATPVDDRLYFAGEAVSPDMYSTIHGAHLSGISAVESAAKVIGLRSNSPR